MSEKRKNRQAVVDDEDEDQKLQRMISNDQSEIESGDEMHVDSIQDDSHEEEEEEEEEGDEEEEEEEEDDDDDDDEEDEGAYQRKRKHRHKHTVAKFFDVSASEEDEEADSSGDSYPGFGDNLDPNEDNGKGNQGMFRNFDSYYNWGYDDGENPWEIVEAMTFHNLLGGRLKRKHAALAVPAKQLRITWTGHRRLLDQSFTIFQNLPAELRLYIWELAFEEISGEPRILPFIYIPSRNAPLVVSPSLPFITSGLRVFMSICHETRAIGVSKFPETLRIQDNTEIRFNPTTDVIWFQSVIMRSFKFEWSLIKSITGKIENLALRPDHFYPNCIQKQTGSLMTLFSFFNCFPRLKNVFLESDLMRNPGNICSWIQSERSVTIRNITVETCEFGEARPIPQIYSFPDIWKHRQALGPSVPGSGSGPFMESFRDFVQLARRVANPSILPSHVHWDMLSKIDFWPIVEIEDMAWPPSLSFECRFGDESTRRLNVPLFARYCQQSRTNLALGLATEIPEEEMLQWEESDNEEDIMPPENIDYYDDDDDEPVQDLLYFPDSRTVKGFYSVINPASDQVAASDEHDNPLSDNEEDSEDQDGYESDFVVADDEVEFEERGDDTLLDDDNSDSESDSAMDKSQRKHRREDRAAIGISDDEEMDTRISEDGSDSDASPLPLVCRSKPQSTGYSGVSGYREAANIPKSRSDNGHEEDSDGDEEPTVTRPRRKRRQVIDESDEQSDQEQDSVTCENGNNPDDSKDDDSGSEQEARKHQAGKAKELVRKRQRVVISDDDDDDDNDDDDDDDNDQ